MPGRVSSGPAKVQKPKTQKKRKNRALNAFAIAEHEQPETTSFRKSRYGEVDGPKRQRQERESEQESEDEDKPRPKRLRPGDKDATGAEVEGGSDSEGNEWLTGRVASDDDSDIDSDDAFGESDEDKFAEFTFRGTTSVKPRRKTKPAALNLDEGNEGDFGLEEAGSLDGGSEVESEGFAADAMDLAAVLDQRDSDSEVEGPSVVQKRSRIGRGARGLEDQTDNYSELSVSGDEMDDADGTNFATLQDFVSGLGNGAVQRKNKANANVDSHEALTPSEYGITSKQKLTIEDLLPTVTDPKARKALRALAAETNKPSRSGSGIPGKLSVPLAKRQQDRIDRSAAYDQSKETLKRWIETVKQTRRAEHLDFPLADPNATSTQNKQLGSASNFKPVTDLETRIQNILEESGMSTKNGKSQDDYIQEMEELETKQMPIEEVRARRAELRKARELLFREEVKARRVKKIKSKSFRRVHRKERERNLLREQEVMAEAGIGPDEEELEQLHRQRAEERMGARHRSSKWAKTVKSSGRATWDEDVRAGVQDMARREEELKKRIEGKSVKADGEEATSESESEVDSDDEDDDAFTRRMANKLDKLQSEEETQGSRLSNLPFMKKAEATKKARNDEDIKQIRKELGEDGGSDQDSEDDKAQTIGRQIFGPQKDVQVALPASTEARNEFEEPEDAEDGTGREFLDRESASVNRTIDTRPPPKRAHKLSENPRRGPVSAAPKEVQDLAQPNTWLSVPKKGRSKHHAPEPTGLAINPTPSLPSAPAPLSKSSSKSPKAPAMLDSRSDSDADSDSDSQTPTTPASTLVTNQERINQAFAGNDDAIASAFAAEKSALAAEEDAPSEDADLDPSSTALPGWGSWVGDGLGKRDKAHAKDWAKKKDAAGEEKEKKKQEQLRQRQDAKSAKVVVSEKRIAKNAAYLASALPHPFESRAQYERSLRLPVGQEWSTTARFEEATKPRLLVKKGRVIQPVRRPLA